MSTVSTRRLPVIPAPTLPSMTVDVRLPQISEVPRPPNTWLNVDVTHRLLLRIVALAACVLPIVATSGSAPRSRRSGAAAIVVPAGVTAAVAVYDRTTGTFTEQRDTALQVRAASVVKLLIALDYLWNLGPDYDVPAADRTRFDVMLRGSDDAAASAFWSRGGGAPSSPGWWPGSAW